MCSERGTEYERSVEELRDRMARAWRGLCRRTVAGASPDDVRGIFDDLRRRYGDKLRAYHNLGHIAECLALAQRQRRHIDQPDALDLAIWYHDAVYDPQHSDNEERSAELAREQLGRLGVPPRGIDAVTGLILATKHAGASLEGDEAWIADIDLAILGSTPEAYERYATAIRREYAFASDADYRAGRSEFLRRLLERREIFGTPVLRAKLESQARVNIEAERLRLTGAGG
jgi:predicted metal-dependent HD superfamily phosphohydrolase